MPSTAEPLEEARFLAIELRAGDRDGIESDAASPALHALLDACFLHRELHAPMVALNTTLPDEAATLALGAAMAPAIEPGTVVYLSGELGVGKTTLVRGILRALGFEGRVKSPTYGLLEVYEVSRLHLHHFDLYRFRDPREWIDAGFRESFNGHTASLIEWPDKAAGLLPPADLEIVLALQGAGRSAALTSNTTKGGRVLARIGESLRAS